jgi:hypothetical protein
VAWLALGRFIADEIEIALDQVLTGVASSVRAVAAADNLVEPPTTTRPTLPAHVPRTPSRGVPPVAVG